MPEQIRDNMKRARLARLAICALFFTNGMFFANVVPRYPEIKDLFSLSDPAYGVTIALSSVGALLAGAGAGVLIRRFPSAKVATWGTVGIATAIALIGAACWWQSKNTGASPWVYLCVAAAFALCGACDSVTDVAQNAHALRVQRLYGRPIINSFHAAWSLGAVLGGLMGVAALAVHLPIGFHLTVAALVCALVGIGALRWALPGADPHIEEEGEDFRVRTRRLPASLVLGSLVLITIAAMLVEESGATWSALYMRDYLHVSPAHMGSAFVVLLCAQTVGRLSADRVMSALGARRTVQMGAALMVAGMGLAACVPHVVTTVVGWACAGYGCAALVPIAFNAAHDIPGLKPGTGLAAISLLGRLSFLLAPPVMGVIVEHTSLWSVMLVVPCAGVAALVCACVIERERPAQELGSRGAR